MSSLIQTLCKLGIGVAFVSTHKFYEYSPSSDAKSIYNICQQIYKQRKISIVIGVSLANSVLSYIYSDKCNFTFRMFLMSTLETVGFLSAYSQLYLDQNILLLVKAQIFATTGSWLTCQLESLITFQKHDQFFEQIVVILFEHFFLRYVTSVLIQNNQLKRRISRIASSSHMQNSDRPTDKKSMFNQHDEQHQNVQNIIKDDSNFSFYAIEEAQESNKIIGATQIQRNFFSSEPLVSVQLIQFKPKKFASASLNFYLKACNTELLPQNQINSELLAIQENFGHQQLHEMFSHSNFRNFQDQIQKLQRKVRSLKAQLEANKVFTYMVIHDLKHPTESLVSQLKILQNRLEEALAQANTLINIFSSNGAATLEQVNFIILTQQKFSEMLFKGLKFINEVQGPIDKNSSCPNSQYSNKSFQNSDNEQQDQLPREQNMKKQISCKIDQSLDSDSSFEFNTEEGNIMMPYVQFEAKIKPQLQSDVQFVSKVHQKVWQALSNQIKQREDFQLFEVQIEGQNKVSVKPQINQPLLSDEIQQKIQAKLCQLSIDCSDQSQIISLMLKNFTDYQFQSEKQITTLCLKNISILDEFNPFLKNMLYGSQMMQNLMMDLLDFAQIDKNTFKLNNSYFNLLDSIQKAFFMLKHVALNKNVDLVVELSDDHRFYFRQIYGDERRFMQVIINLLSNSLKFSNKDTQIIIQLEVLNEKIAYQPSQEAQDHSLVLNNVQQNISFILSIQDFGCGFPEDKLDNLFLNFGKLEEHSDINPTGRGLGLSICRSIVEQMGGTVTVSSKVGFGSKFSLAFNTLCNHTSTENLTEQQLQAGPSDIIIGNKPKLLIANDELYLSMSYQTQLQGQFQIYAVENGQQSFKLITSQEIDYFDVILLDINMPVMDGLEACIHIQNYFHLSQTSINKYIPIVYALTGESSPDQLKKIMQFQFESVLSNIGVENTQMILNEIRQKRGLIGKCAIKETNEVIFNIIEDEL